MAVRVNQARADLLGQVREPGSGPWFAEAAVSAVGSAVGYDGWCLFAVDPLTGIRTVMFSRDALQCPQERMVHNEMVEHDQNRYADLVRSHRRVGVLSASGHAVPRSPRLHEILLPEGFRSELRLALVADGRYWGALSLWRDDSRHPFSDDESLAAVALGDALSQVVRRYHVAPISGDAPALPAGVVLFDRHLRLLSTSPEALAWLAELADPWPNGVTAADVVRMVHEVARAATEHTAPPLCRVRLPRGGWLVASGTPVESGDLGVAVVLTSGDARTVAPAFAAWCGLTPREAQVLEGLTHGLTSRSLARSLSISPRTIDDHLKAVYRKARVRGRDELLALLR